MQPDPSDPSVEAEALAAYSRAEITRQDVGDRLGGPISFGDLLAKLHQHGLPLPRFPSDPNSPGIELIARLARRGAEDRSEPDQPPERAMHRDGALDVPLYTYVMSHRGVTKVAQLRRSNYVGWILPPIAESYPSLRPAFADLMRMRPEPVPNAKRAWACSIDVEGEPFTLHVVETRD